MRQNSKQNSRRPYKKPGLRVVELAAKEALAVGCKTGSSGPDVGNPGCQFKNCTTSGSS